MHFIVMPEQTVLPGEWRYLVDRPYGELTDLCTLRAQDDCTMAWLMNVHHYYLSTDDLLQ